MYINSKFHLILYIIFIIKVQSLLHGIAYTPFRTFGECPSEEEVKEDMLHILQYTKRIRLYSTECPSVNRVLLHYATYTDVSLLLGVWIDNNKDKDQLEIDNLISALHEFPNAKLDGISVGNEVLYRQTMSSGQVAQRIIEVKHKVRCLGQELGGKYLSTVPVFGVEIYPNAEIIAVSDAQGANIHPFYRTDLEEIENIEEMMENAVNKAMDQIHSYQEMAQNKPIIITEIGWPTMSDTSSEIHRANEDMAKIFMQKLSLKCHQENINYYWFEFFDSEWKKALFPEFSNLHSEFHFGIFENDRKTPKSAFSNIEI